MEEGGQSESARLWGLRPDKRMTSPSRHETVRASSGKERREDLGGGGGGGGGWVGGWGGGGGGGGGGRKRRGGGWGGGKKKKNLKVSRSYPAIAMTWVAPVSSTQAFNYRRKGLLERPEKEFTRESNENIATPL